jgi:competence protein ComEC
VPIATCVFALALWCGCALADSSAFAAVSMAQSARTLMEALLDAACAAAVVASVLAVADLVACSGMRGERPMPSFGTEAFGAAWARFALIGFAALCLGAGLRYRQCVEQSDLPRIMLDPHAGDEGQLVTIECTIRSPFTAGSFGPDLLAVHFRKPPRFRGTADGLVFISDDGRRVALPSEAEVAITVPEHPPPWLIGERLRLVGALYPVGAPVFPCGIDPRESAVRRGRIGTLVVESDSLATPVSDWNPSTPLLDEVARIREQLRTRMREALLAGVPAHGDRGAADDAAIDSMLVALVLGDVEKGYREIENGFRAAGISHILAISGFNLAVLGWVVAAISGLFLRDERLRAVPVVMAAAIALWVMAPAASAIRSALMAVIGAGGRVFSRDWNGDAVLAAAAAVMLVHSPSDAGNPGFQLSFLCVIALRRAAPVIRNRWFGFVPRDDGRHAVHAGVAIAADIAASAVSAGLAAFLASVPIALVHFGTVQPIGIALTLLATPLSTVTLGLAYPKVVLGLPVPWLTSPLGPILWATAWLQVELVELSLSWFGGATNLGRISAIGGAGLLILLTVAVLSESRRMVIAAVSVLSAVIVWFFCFPIGSSRVRDGPELEITMFAVGDGSAYIVRSRSSVVLFDCGSSSIGGVGSSALLPMIADAGGRVDAVVISHPNLDHFSALLDLARYAKVGEVIVHDSLLAARTTMPAVEHLLSGIEATDTAIQSVAAGDHLEFGGCSWHVLWPALGFRSSRDNDLSLVMKIVHAETGASVLLSGDVETEPSARLADRALRGEVDIRADLFELPHHGSWREAVVGYMREVKPTVVLQSTARRRFDSDRFANHIGRGVMRFVTCRDGTVRLVLDRSDGLPVWRASIFDADAASGWRSAGRFERPRSARMEEARALEHHDIPSDSVATIRDGDHQFAPR